ALLDRVSQSGEWRVCVASASQKVWRELCNQRARTSIRASRAGWHRLHGGGQFRRQDEGRGLREGLVLPSRVGPGEGIEGGTIGEGAGRPGRQGAHVPVGRLGRKRAEVPRG